VSSNQLFPSAAPRPFLRRQTLEEPRGFGKESCGEKLAKLRIDVMNAMDHLLNEECSFYDVQVAPDRISASLREALELDRSRGLELVEWVACYFPDIARDCLEDRQGEDPDER